MSGIRDGGAGADLKSSALRSSGDAGLGCLQCVAAR